MNAPLRLLLVGIFGLLARGAAGQPSPTAVPTAPEYLPNHGQWPAAVRLRADVGPGLRLFAEAGRLVWLRYDAAAWGAWTHAASHPNRTTPRAERQSVRAHAWAVEFVGATRGVMPRPEGAPTGPVRNYLLGRDARHWATGIRGTAAARYARLWPGIDLRLHASAEGNFEYDLEVQPGANPALAVLRYEGLESVRLDARTGHLHLRTALGELTEAAPVAWQSDARGGRRLVPVRFVLTPETNKQPSGASRAARVSFAFPAGFDRNRALTVDPVLVFATHSGATSPVFGHTATYDRLGHLYAAGPSYDPGYPTTTGAFDLTHSNDTISGSYGNPDVAISRYAPDGHTLRYATYLGGTAPEYPHSLLVNHRGDLLVLGTTLSPDFPTTASAYDTAYSQAHDIFVARLDSTGSQLLGSTYLGGQADDGYTQAGLPFFYGDNYRGDLEVDSLDRVYVATTTASADFPFTAGAVRPPAGFQQTAVVARFAPDLSNLDWAAGLGRQASAYSLHLLPSGAPYVVGTTFSTGFPTTAGTLAPDSTQGAGNRQRDGFVALLSPGADSVRASTYLRPALIGQPTSQTFFVQGIPGSTDVVVLGSSTGQYPVSPGRWGQPNAGLVLQRLSANLRQRRWVTTIGHPLTMENPGFPSTDNLSPTAFLVDRCGALYVSAWGNTTGLATTANALQRTTDGQDLYMLVLTPDAAALEYATYLGGRSANSFAEEHVDGGTCRFDPQGRIYQAICTNSADFPTTPGAWSPQTQVLNQAYDEVSVKLDFERRLVQAVATAADTVGGPADELTAPATVQFGNRSTTFPGTTYQWTFGDNSAPSPAFSPRHTYTRGGVFTVTLIVRDAGSCAGADTMRFPLIIHPPDTTRFGEFGMCRGDSARLNGVLLEPGSFTWSPGATLSDSTAVMPWAHPDTTTTYSAYGILASSYPTQRVRWNVTIRVFERLQAAAAATAIGGGPATGLTAPVAVQLVNNTPAVPGTRWRWSFGDNSASDTTRAPQHTYARGGTFTVWLRAFNSANSCNGADSAQFQLTINQPDSAAAASFSICRGDSVQLTGVSLQPGSFGWSPAASLSDSTALSPWARPDSTTTYTAFGTLPGSTQRIRWTVTVTVRARLQVAATAAAVGGGPASGQPAPATVQFANATARVPPTRWTWRFGDNSPVDTARSPQHTFTRAGTFTVWLVGRSPNACNAVDSVQLTITVNRPDSVAAAAFSICRGDSVQLVGVALQPGSFSWSPAASLSDSTALNPWAAPDSTTTYAAFGTLPNSTQRIRWAVTVTVRERLRVGASATAVGGGPASGQQAPATVQLVNATPPLPGTRWLWRFGDGSAPDTARAPQHVFARAGTFTLWLVGRNGEACNGADSTQLTITVNQPDTLTSRAFSICPGDSVQLPGRELVPGTFRWSPDSTLSDGTAPAPWAAPRVTTTYAATGDYAGQARRLTVQATVTVLTPAPVSWTATQRCRPGGSVATFRLAAPLPASGTWEFGDGGTAPLAGATVNHTFALPPGEQLFNVSFRGRDAAGCAVEARQEFRAETFQVPNIITPGTPDGRNDALQLPCFAPGTATLLVYNRWGRLVYDSGTQGYANDWRAEGLSAGTYYYQLRLTDDPAPYRGWVEVVR